MALYEMLMDFLWTKGPDSRDVQTAENLSGLLGMQVDVQKAMLDHQRARSFVDVSRSFIKSQYSLPPEERTPRICFNCGYECLSARCPKCRTYGLRS